MKQVRILFLLFLFSFNVPAYATDLPPEPATGFQDKTIVHAKEYMVVSGNPLASEAGAEMLRQGGNAVDAAIAVQMVLNVVEPQSSGIGGGGFMMYYDKAGKHITAYDGRETAPAAATEDMFLNKQGKPMAYFDALKGGLSVGTPGVLKMLELAHKEQGKLPWNLLFQPAIVIAENGFPLSTRVRETIGTTPYISYSPEAKALFFTSRNNIKPVGSLIQNPALAKTFRLIAKEGAGAFYHGKLAKAIVGEVQSDKLHPGRLTTRDLAAYQVVKREALCDSYHHYRICGMPPPTSGGITVLQTLKLLERFKLQANTAETIHLVAEASRLAFADRNRYIADCKDSAVPMRQMLSSKYIAKRSKLIKKNTVLKEVKPGMLRWNAHCGRINAVKEHPSTTHFSIVDKQGNAVSMTSSIEYSFGSGMMVQGFFLNNQLTDFSFVPKIDGVKVANKIAPGKRPRSSMAPMLVFDKKGRLALVVGSPGGVRIIPYVLQTLLGVLDWKMPIHEAINQPHFANIGAGIELEKGTPITALMPKLKALGYEVVASDLNSGLHGIEIQKGELVSGVDKRREGGAVGE